MSNFQKVHLNFQKVRSGEVLVQVGEVGPQGRHLWPTNGFYGHIKDCPWKEEALDALPGHPIYTPDGKPC